LSSSSSDKLALASSLTLLFLDPNALAKDISIKRREEMTSGYLLEEDEEEEAAAGATKARIVFSPTIL